MRQRTRVLLWLGVYSLALPLLFVAFTRWSRAESGAGAWGGEHLAIVADTTATMGPALDALAAGHAAWEPLTATYHLVGFKDEPLYLGNTASSAEFQTWLDGLEATGGGACPDNGLAGLLELARHTPKGNTPATDALLVTDASPQGQRAAYVYTLSRLLRRGVQAHVLLNGWCPGAPLSPEALGFVALASGGEFLPTDPPHYVTDTLIALNLMGATDRLNLVMGSVAVGEPDLIPLSVDTTLTSLGVDAHIWCLTCTLQAGGGITIELFDPDDNPVGPGDPGYERLMGASHDWHRYAPAGAVPTGTWTLRVSGDGEYTVNVVAGSNFHLAYQGAPSLAAGQPAPFRVVLGEVGPGGGVLSPLTATFQMREMMTGQIQPIDLFDDGQHGDEAAGDGLFGGLVTPQTPGLWLLGAAGQLADGAPFQRLDPAVIRVHGFQLADPPQAVAVPGSTSTINFALVNDGPAGLAGAQTFELALFSELGWAITKTVPATVTLQPGELLNLAVSVQVPADAPPGTVEETSLVALPVDDLSQSATAVAETTVVAMIDVYLPAMFRQP